MLLKQALLAHAVAAFAVSLLVLAGMLLDAYPNYLSLRMVGLLPLVYFVVYVVSVGPVILARRWAARKGLITYWRPAFLGAGLGAVLYGGFVVLLNGREFFSEPDFAVSVLASGIGLGVVGALVFLATERRLKNRAGAL